MRQQLSFMEDRPICVLMSLREEYYEAMLSGKKKYEYRTRYLKDVSDAYIYISKTKKSIVAKIRFAKPIIGNALDIACLAEENEKGSFDDIKEYLHNDIGYAMEVLSITPIKEVTLKELQEKFPDFVAPQSYYILDKKPELLEFLESRIERNEKIYD